MSVVATVPSLRMNGDRYEIQRLSEKVYCDCPAASFGKTGTQCKHVKIFSAASAAIAACQHVGGAMCLQCVIDLLATLAAEVEKTKRRKR